jgi:hypothetical protein
MISAKCSNATDRSSLQTSRPSCDILGRWYIDASSYMGDSRTKRCICASRIFCDLAGIYSRYLLSLVWSDAAFRCITAFPHLHRLAQGQPAALPPSPTGLSQTLGEDLPCWMSCGFDPYSPPSHSIAATPPSSRHYAYLYSTSQSFSLGVR